MNTVRVVRVSSKGQIVIPQDIREKFSIKEGDYLLIAPLGQDLILIKKIVIDNEEYRTFAEKFAKILQDMGFKITKKELDKAIEKLIKDMYNGA